MHELSGVQLVVRSLRPENFPDGKSDPKHENPKYFPFSFDENETHRCAICGGLLTNENILASEKISEQWISNAELEAKDEDYICRACAWMLTSKNRTRFLRSGKFHVYTGEDTLVLTAPEFLEFLRSDFKVPCVIAICDDFNRTQKHTAWKMNRSVTYHRSHTIVDMFQIRIFNSATIEGTAVFDADEFVSMIKELVKLLNKLKSNEKFQQIFKTDGSRYYGAMQKLYNSINGMHISSEEMMFAVYLATNIAFFREDKEKKKEGKANG